HPLCRRKILLRSPPEIYNKRCGSLFCNGKKKSADVRWERGEETEGDAGGGLASTMNCRLLPWRGRWCRRGGGWEAAPTGRRGEASPPAGRRATAMDEDGRLEAAETELGGRGGAVRTRHRPGKRCPDPRGG
ncbi:unnamed protein product, partial [Urochloa humidicola]